MLFEIMISDLIESNTPNDKIEKNAESKTTELIAFMKRGSVADHGERSATDRFSHRGIQIE